MRILAIDPGEKRIGVAISDESGTIANPLKVILHTSRKEDAAAVLDVYNGLKAGLIVVGQALDEDGQVSHSGMRAKRLADEISAQQAVPVTFWDESFSTNDAREARLLMNVRRRKRAGHIDDIAAVVILQSYLDEHAGS
jgi:putative Holliday junction resolvase